MSPSRSRRSKIALWGFSIVALLCATRGRVNGFTLTEWWREQRSGIVISHVHTSRKVVALTFDDGPDPAYTPRVLDILARYSVHATFFEEGKQIDRYPELTNRVAAAGHSLGNHTYTHPYLTRLSEKKIRWELQAADQALERDAHLKTDMFRPPRGEWNPAVFTEVNRGHDHLILWSVALEHQALPTPQAMAASVLDRVNPGDIILMHDGGSVPRETTVQALPLLMEGLRQRGYACVTVPELLHIPGNARLPIVQPR